MIHFRWKWICSPAKKVEATIKANIIDHPIVTSGSQYQYVPCKISQNPKRASIKTIKKIIKFSQNWGLTCGDMATHFSRDFSYSSMSFFTTSLNVRTLNSNLRSASFSYTSRWRRIWTYSFPSFGPPFVLGDMVHSSCDSEISMSFRISSSKVSHSNLNFNFLNFSYVSLETRICGYSDLGLPLTPGIVDNMDIEDIKFLSLVMTSSTDLLRRNA